MLGVEWWAEPMEQPADRTSLQQYDVDGHVLARWCEARKEYLSPRARLLRQIERQGFRAPRRPHAGGGFVDVEDADGSSTSVGEWLQRDDGYWVLRIATGS
jgi:hypothetical protein